MDSESIINEEWFIKCNKWRLRFIEWLINKLQLIQQSIKTQRISQANNSGHWCKSFSEQ